MKEHCVTLSFINIEQNELENHNGHNIFVIMFFTIRRKLKGNIFQRYWKPQYHSFEAKGNPPWIGETFIAIHIKRTGLRLYRKDF